MTPQNIFAFANLFEVTLCNFSYITHNLWDNKIGGGGRGGSRRLKDKVRTRPIFDSFPLGVRNISFLFVNKPLEKGFGTRFLLSKKVLKNGSVLRFDSLHKKVEVLGFGLNSLEQKVRGTNLLTTEP